MLARYLGDGRLDAGFGRSGTVVTRTPGIDWRVAVQAVDGTIVVAGATSRRTAGAGDGTGGGVVTAADGRLDRSFAGDGLTVTSARAHWAGAVELAVDRSGRIVLGTHGHSGSRAGFALVRLRRNGALDRAFGNGGLTVSEVGYGVHALGLDRQGRIVTVGRTNSLLDFVAARFLPDGRRDPSFAGDGHGLRRRRHAVRARDPARRQDGRGRRIRGLRSAGLAGDIVVARYLSS